MNIYELLMAQNYLKAYPMTTVAEMAKIQKLYRLTFQNSKGGVKC
jgi:hypothetical protein